jgi:archaellum component FlaC
MHLKEPEAIAEAGPESEAETEADTEDADTRERIAALEEKANQHDHVIGMMQDKVTQLSTDFGHLVGEVSAVRSASSGLQTLSEEVSALKTQISQKLNDPVVEQLSTYFIELCKEVLTLNADISALSTIVIRLRHSRLLHLRPFRRSIHRSFQTVRRSLQNSVRHPFHLRDGAAAMVSMPI